MINLEYVTINLGPSRTIPAGRQPLEVLSQRQPPRPAAASRVRSQPAEPTGMLLASRARFLTRLVRLGPPADRRDDLDVRVAREGTRVLGQRKLFQRAVPGL